MSDLKWMRPKLAELCGYEYKAQAIMPFYKHPDGTNMIPGHWHPDEDVAQAIRCADAFSEHENQRTLWGIRRVNFNPPGYWFEIMFDTGRVKEFPSAATPARAICLAIAAALGWKDETKSDP